MSRVALGSWRTFERIPREDGLAVMVAAREAGIDFLDDARYDDETGTAPIPTGYSEVVFGELFRAAGWPRDEVVVANKLWWEFWPEQSAAARARRLARAHGARPRRPDLRQPPPDGLPVDEMVAQVAGLIEAGKLRAWGSLNWPAGLLAEAGRGPRRRASPAPAAVQLPYSLVRRSPVEDADVAEALGASGTSVVASAVLAGGALSGKYGAGGHAESGGHAGARAGRLAAQRDDPALAPAFAAAADLRALAAGLDTAPAALAIAFALSHDSVASVLFGATSPAQIAENVAALDLLDRLGDDELARLRTIGG